ncbi:hypothetical protein HAX54_047162 [Datura stramonium]|uniref:Uncharacterized protein n=1 Tax=Datura stramonium TaxID=4076 RepID=A0ABS8SST5_DATST|nr:hypothetical protein [Datura stramonium]
MHNIFQIEGKKKRIKLGDKPFSSASASRKARECGSRGSQKQKLRWRRRSSCSSWSTSIFKHLSIPRTFEAQEIAHRNFLIPTLLNFTPTQEIGNSLEVAAEETVAAPAFAPTATQVENEDKVLGMCEEEEERMDEEEEEEDQEDQHHHRLDGFRERKAWERK